MNEADPSQGLSSAEAALRRSRGESNRPPRSQRRDYGLLVSRNLLTLFNALVVPAAIALFLLGDYRAAWAVSAMAVANSLIGLVQEFRAKRHLDRLALLAESKARVLRDGVEVTIPAGDVVRGDCIRIRGGESVVADGAVLTSHFLEIDEALLTGESDPIRRNVGDDLRSGSFAVAGEGVYRADRVGADAYANRTTAEARSYRFSPGPLQRTLDRLIRLLTLITVILCAIYLFLYWIRGFPTTDLVQMVAATVTSMVPQGLVLMTTVALTLGAVRLTARGAAVQRLSAVEAMASIDVVCSDKTGTLTTNRLAVDEIRSVKETPESIRAKLALFAWGSIDESNRTIQALRGELEKPDGPVPVIDQVPFKSQSRSSAVRIREGTGERLLVLGSLDALRPRFHGEHVNVIESIFQELLPTGLRLLAFAEGVSAQSFDEPLRLLALIVLRDELRSDAADVLKILNEQGVRLIVLSGDHPETVWATIKQLKIPFARNEVHTGTEFDAAADRGRMVEQSAVFGRVVPQQKVDIVSLLQARGHRAAMIGDGVNDILAVKSADLGIAMGSGTSATKTVAGLVLENDRFDLLPHVLDEGRTVVHNVRRAAKLFLLKNVYTLTLIVGLVGLLRDGFPYLPQQVTLLNFLTIGGPVLLILLNRAPPGVPAKAAFIPEVARFVLGYGLPIGIAGLTVWQWGQTIEEKRTILLTMLVFAGLDIVRLTSEGDRRLWVWCLLGFLAYVAVHVFPPVTYFFGFVHLTWVQWGLSAIAAVIANTIGKWMHNRFRFRDHDIVGK